MSQPFGTPGTTPGFGIGTAAQPVGGAATGNIFGTARGAGDATKPTSFGLPEMTPQSQVKPASQGFAASFATPNLGAPSTGASTFGTSPSWAMGFGTPASGTTGFAIPQPNTTTPANTGTVPGGLTFGTPIATSTAVNSQPGQLSFQTPGGQAPNLGPGAQTAPSAAPGFNFGNSATTTASGLSFNPGGTPATSAAPQATATVHFGPPKTNVPSIAATTAGGQGGLVFGASLSALPDPTGFNMFNTSAPTIPSTGKNLQSITPASSASGGFNLSTPQTQPPQTTFNLSATTATTSAPAASGFNLATPAAGTFAVPNSAPTTAASAFNLPGTTTATNTSGFTLSKSTAPPVSTVAQTSAPQTSLGTATNVTASTVATSQAGGINFCQLEESINKWTLELEEQEKAFVNQATQVNSWDRLLIANGEKIVTLNQEVERVKLEQQQLEHELDYVVGQQRELQDCLVPLEKELGSVTASDPEREYTYRLAENLDTQLKQMSEDLKEIIEHLNEANRSQDSSDPIVQIGKILNAHMNSLQWLDQRTAVLQTKIQQIDQLHQNFRQEHERSFNLAYN